MKKVIFGATFLLVGILGFGFAGAGQAHAAQIIVTAAPALAPQDAQMLKQSLDILKQTLDLLGAKIQASPAPMENAAVINANLSGLKTTLIALNTTLAGFESSNLAQQPQSPASLSDNSPAPEISATPQSSNQESASVSSAFGSKNLTFPLAAAGLVIVVIVVWLLKRNSATDVTPPKSEVKNINVVHNTQEKSA